MEFPFRNRDSRTAKGIATFDNRKCAWLTLVATVEGDTTFEGFYSVLVKRAVGLAPPVSLAATQGIDFSFSSCR